MCAVMLKNEEMAPPDSGFIRVGTVSEIRERCRLVVPTPSGAVLIVAAGEEVVALDNRCPHMGFPLHRGTIEDGILDQT